MESNLEKALKLVIKAHSGQKRRNEDIDFCYHPIAVAMNLQAYGMEEDIVIIGLLHDLIEDTEYDYEYIKNNFSKYIADSVLLLSEDKSIKDFKERKSKFLKQIEHIDEKLSIVELFDKMHNLTSDYDYYNKVGMEMYKTSNSNYETIRWFYLSILETCTNNIQDKNLVDKFEKVIKYYFN